MGYGSFTNYENQENYILQKFPGILTWGGHYNEVILLLRMHLSYVWGVWDHNDVQYIFNYGNYLS